MMQRNKNTHKDTLKQAIQKTFDEITSNNEWELLAILLASMPKHLTAMKLVQSKQIRY